MGAKKVEYKGKIYKSIRALAEEFNISDKELYVRLSKGMTLDEAINHVPERGYTVFGTTYKTIADVAEAYNISATTIYTRTHNGSSLEEAVKGGQNKRVITVFGKKYKSKRAFADEFDISYAYLLGKLKEGYSIEDAVKEITEKPIIHFDGKDYNTATELALEYKMDSIVMSSRKHQGWSLEESVTRPIGMQNKNNKYLYKGVTYGSQREMAEARGFTSVIVGSLRVKLDITFIEALAILDDFLDVYEGDRPDILNVLPFVIYKDKWYQTLPDFCRDVGLNAPLVQDYRRYNYIDSFIETFERMSNAEKECWIDNETDEVATATDLVMKYKKNVRYLEAKGFIRKGVRKVFPNCTFDSEVYCATPKMDFIEFLKGRYGR